MDPPTTTTTPIAQLLFFTGEFRSLVYGSGYYLNDDELAAAVRIVDKDGNGTIEYNEFKAWWSQDDRCVTFAAIFDFFPRGLWRSRLAIKRLKFLKVPSGRWSLVPYGRTEKEFC